MNFWEALYKHMHYKQGSLIPEQYVTDTMWSVHPNIFSMTFYAKQQKLYTFSVINSVFQTP